MKADQIDLVGAIAKYLARTESKHVNARQYNAIIAAANMIMDALATPHQPATPGMGLDAWRRCDDTGASSLYLAGVLVGTPTAYAHPYDAGDFGRCYKLLLAVPELRDKLPTMRSASPQWARLVDQWDELERLYVAGEHKAVSDLVAKSVSEKTI